MGVLSEANDHCSNDFSVVPRPCRELGTLPVQRLGALPPPLAGEGWGGGELAPIFLRAPSLSLPPRRGRGPCGASVGIIIVNSARVFDNADASGYRPAKPGVEH